MQWSRTLVGMTSVVLGLLLCSEAYDAIALADEQELPDTQTILDGIQELAELVVLEVQLTEVATGSVSGHTGGTTVTMLVRGSVTFAVDLEQAQFVEVDEQRKRLVLELPSPEVRDVTIDHDRSSVLSCQRRGLWIITVGEGLEDQAIMKAMRIGQQRLENAASRSDLTIRAKRHTEVVLSQFVGELGWGLDVRWGE